MEGGRAGPKRRGGRIAAPVRGSAPARARRTPALAADALLGRGGREALGRSDAPGVAYQAEGSPRESEE